MTRLAAFLARIDDRICDFITGPDPILEINARWRAAQVEADAATRAHPPR